jgi:hypothetical protein
MVEAYVMRKNRRMIGYCGNNCHLCVARSEDPVVRQKLVDGWRKFFGHEMYTAENVKCDGWPTDGEVADKQCKARPCAKKKGIKSCALCDGFPCDKLKPLIQPYFFANKEEYILCMRQFHGAPNLIKILTKKGKKPQWLEAYLKASQIPYRNTQVRQSRK